MSKNQIKIISANGVIVILVLIITVAAFFIGRNSSRLKPQPVYPDISRYERAIDSLEKLKNMYVDSVIISYKRLDSLSKAKVINNNFVKNEKTRIDNFTPDSRAKWNDSVLRANGLK